MKSYTAIARKTELENVVYFTYIGLYYSLNCNSYYLIDCETGSHIFHCYGIMYIRTDRRYIICARNITHSLSESKVDLKFSDIGEYYGDLESGNLIIDTSVCNTAKYKNASFPEYIDILDETYFKIYDLDVSIVDDSYNSKFGINLGNHFNSSMRDSAIYKIDLNCIYISICGYVDNFMANNLSSYEKNCEESTYALLNLFPGYGVGSRKLAIQVLDDLRGSLEEYISSDMGIHIVDYMASSDFVEKYKDNLLTCFNVSNIFSSMKFKNIRNIL